ncbi:MAG TPA: nucleotidyltransferase family protein [Silvibacterium sp.]|nr:nucleotidyltransferase family protein [Silvibacterium sp.]
MARSDSQLSAIVLAAGRSARMGEAKQLLRLGGRTVLERTLENVRGAALEKMILVLGFSAETIREQISEALLEDVTVVVNRDFEQGMASSLRKGLSAVAPGMNAGLIVLADQPFVRPETMRLLVERYRCCEAEIVIPVHEGRRGNPVVLDWAVFPEAMALEGDTGCRAIFGKHAKGIVEVEVDDPGILLDIDSREDYERARGLKLF